MNKEITLARFDNFRGTFCYGKIKVTKETKKLYHTNKHLYSKMYEDIVRESKLFNSTEIYSTTKTQEELTKILIEENYNEMLHNLEKQNNNIERLKELLNE